MINGKLRGKVECPYCKCELSFELVGRAEPFEEAKRCPNPDCERLIVITGEIAIVNVKALKVKIK